MNRYAGAVVLYNPTEEVFENINTYIAYLEKLYIVDNSDNTNINVESVLDDKLVCDRYEYINLSENKGIAVALNMGISKAIEDKFSWILTMDQDSYFANNIIQVYDDFLMSNKYDGNEIAILAPHYKTDRHEESCDREIKEVYWTMQSANLINTDIVKELGGLEENYFIDCVDYEFCLRVKKRGYKIIRCNNAILVHAPAMTQKKWGLSYGVASPTRIYYQVRNAMYMFRKYKNIRSLLIVMIKLVKILVLFNNKKEYFRKVKKAIFDYKHGITGKMVE